MPVAGPAVDSVHPTTEELARRVDSEIETLVERSRPAFVLVAPEAAVVADEILRVVRAGGKRLRPAFCYWGYRAAGGDDRAEIVRIAAALELFHTAALIHDDVMDRASLRRGQPTTHRHLAADGGSDGSRFGVGAAILVGDLAFALAAHVLAASRLPNRFAWRSMLWFGRMATHVVAGQFLDLRASSRGEVDEDTALRIATLKSGSYTVEIPLLLGASLGRNGAALMEPLSRYGRHLGLAFQLRDDVLGVFGELELTGKEIGQDVREGKVTFLLARALALATPEQRRHLLPPLRPAPLSAEQAEAARTAMRETGALDDTLSYIEQLAAIAVESIADVSITADAAEALRGLTQLVRSRDA